MLELQKHFLTTNQDDLEIEDVVYDLYQARERELIRWFTEEWMRVSTEDELRECWESIKGYLEELSYTSSSSNSIDFD